MRWNNVGDFLIFVSASAKRFWRFVKTTASVCLTVLPENLVFVTKIRKVGEAYRRVSLPFQIVDFRDFHRRSGPTFNLATGA